MCCEASEKNFWITVGVFAVIWGVSVQYPYVVEETVELEHVIHSDAYNKISDVEEWFRWNSVYDVNITESPDTNSFFYIRPRSLPFGDMTWQVRVTNNDDNVKSLCWTWEQISPIMSAYHCHNVTQVLPPGATEDDYGHARLLNHQVFYGPLSLLLHAYAFDIEADAKEFNAQFLKSFDDYA